MKTDWVKKHGNEQAIRKFLDYPERIQKGYQFKYYFISTGTASARVMEKEEDYNKKYERSNLDSGQLITVIPLIYLDPMTMSDFFDFSSSYKSINWSGL